MTNDQLQGLIRNVLMFVGGLAVSKGYVDAATSTAIIGGAVALFGAVWSWLHLGKLSA